MSNQKMFMYGVGANALSFLGVVLAIIGLAMLTATKAGWIFVILGIGIVIKGKAMRFDYKRQSGSIIHKGDF